MKKILLIAFLVVASTTLSAQNNERIKAFKMGYITEQLNLSTAEAEKFWPIFNEFEDKTQAIKRKIHNCINHVFGEYADNKYNYQIPDLLKESLLYL